MVQAPKKESVKSKIKRILFNDDFSSPKSQIVKSRKWNKVLKWLLQQDKTDWKGKSLPRAVLGARWGQNLTGVHGPWKGAGNVQRRKKRSSSLSTHKSRAQRWKPSHGDFICWHLQGQVEDFCKLLLVFPMRWSHFSPRENQPISTATVKKWWLSGCPRSLLPWWQTHRECLRYLFVRNPWSIQRPSDLFSREGHHNCVAGPGTILLDLHPSTFYLGTPKWAQQHAPL